MISARHAFLRIPITSGVTLLALTTSLSAPEFDDVDVSDIGDTDYVQTIVDSGFITETVINPVARQARNSEDVNFVGHGDGDQRDYVLNTEVQYNGIGYVNGVCTGTLISPNQVLTAAHCIPDDENADITFSIVHTAINGDEDRLHLQAADVWTHPQYEPSNDETILPRVIPYDIAVILLETPAPDAFNTFPIATMPSYVTNAEVLGYPGDLMGLTIHTNVQAIITENHHYALSTYDMAQGSSGGPMIYDGHIIGVNSANNVAQQRAYQAAIYNGIFSDPSVDWLPDEAELEIRIVEVGMTSRLNVRSEPHTGASINNGLQDGDCVIVDRTLEGGWLQVRFNPLTAPSAMQNISAEYVSEPRYMDAYSASEMCPNFPSPA